MPFEADHRTIATETGIILHNARIGLDVGQIETARAAGIATSTYNRIERGSHRNPSQRAKEGIAYALGVPIEVFDLQEVHQASTEEVSKVKEARKSLGLSQKEAAEASGISLSQYNRIERGHIVHLHKRTSEKLSKGLHIEQK